MPTIAEALAAQRADVFAALKPLQEYVAAQQKSGEVDLKGKPGNPPGALPWQVTLNQDATKWLEPPKPGQIIVPQKDGTFKLLPATAAMGASMGAGGFLEMIERPINNLWPALPLGSLVVGAVVGITVGELVDAFVMPVGIDGRVNFVNVAVKGGAIVGLVMFGSTLMSGTAKIVSIGLLGAQILSDVLPLDQWIRNFVNWVRRLFGMAPTTTAPAQGQYRQEVLPPGNFTGARDDLYAGIFGGR